MKLTEEQFCKMVQGYDGEPIDKIGQISLISFNGEELKDFIEHCFKFNNVVFDGVSISSISHIEIDKWAKEYASGTNQGFRRLDFFNGALSLKQKLEGTDFEL
jgi:hypothetical protein